jgi:signal transduction histidine kinase
VDYVTKPFKAEEISARVETHLALRRLQQELELSHLALQSSYAKLEALEQARQRLVQMVVHDLKNPIATIQICADVLQQEPALQGEARLAVEDVSSMARLMTRMVLDVLDVARTEQVELKPRLAAFPLRDLLAEVEGELRGLVRCSRRELLVEVAPGAPVEVLADRDLVRRVLANLLDNALKYAPRRSTVRLEAGPAGSGRYALVVADQGQGIPAELRQRIFEPYARLDQDVDRHARTSRGLGLAFCRLAVEAHGGSIRVEDALPQGSRFVVELPVGPGAPAAQPVAPPAA